MSSRGRNIVAVIAGVVVGFLLNGGLIALSPMLIPPPEGVDVTSTEGLKAGIHLFEPRHFLMPFLAHALGTLFGAFTTYKLAATNKMQLGWLIGAIFLVGGVMASMMIPAPTWFKAVDILAAYLPMAWLGSRLAAGTQRGSGLAG